MDDTVMLVCAGGQRPGIFDWFGYGTQSFHPFRHPQSGLILMRCTQTAAVEYLLRGGCYIAPDELQDADR